LAARFLHLATHALGALGDLRERATKIRQRAAEDGAELAAAGLGRRLQIPLDVLRSVLDSETESAAGGIADTAQVFLEVFGTTLDTLAQVLPG
jgi:phage gp36-like protein